MIFACLFQLAPFYISSQRDRVDLKLGRQDNNHSLPVSWKAIIATKNRSMAHSIKAREAITMLARLPYKTLFQGSLTAYKSMYKSSFSVQTLSTSSPVYILQHPNLLNVQIH
jgi:hypothetical protein